MLVLEGDGERLCSPVPELGSSELWGPPCSISGQEGGPGLGHSSTSLAGFIHVGSGWERFKTQTLACLYRQWLLVVLKVKIKLPTAAGRDVSAVGQPPEPLIPTTYQLSLAHRVPEGVMPPCTAPPCTAPTFRASRPGPDFRGNPP